MKCESLSRIPDGRWYCEECGRVSPKATAEPPNMQCGGARKRKPVLPGMVGMAMQRIIQMLALKRVSKDCGCVEMIHQMNTWGVDGCREHRAEIIEHLRTAYNQLTWGEWCAAIASAAKTGLALRLVSSDPLGSMLDEAIRLATPTQVA